jgi:hypothetical protein
LIQDTKALIVCTCGRLALAPLAPLGVVRHDPSCPMVQP